MRQFTVKAVIPQVIKQPLFGVAFDKYRSRENVFAVVGGRYVIVAKPHKTDGIEILSTFVDENVDEDLFVCAWTRDETSKDPLLCVAGGVGVVKVINTRLQKVIATFIGHGDEIYDLKISPVHPYIIGTAANDHTLRLWTLDPRSRTQPTIAICGGEGGHREGVLTMAFHSNPLYLISGGMDHAVCLWICPILHQSSPRIPVAANAIPPTTDLPERYSYPHLSTTAVHTDYVDCVEFHNDFILSKSSREGKIVLWHILGFDSQRKYDNTTAILPPPTTHEWKETRSAFGESVERLMQFDIRHCEPWFMKFGVFSSPVDPSKLSQQLIGPGFGTFMAMGNLNGNVYVWDLSLYETTVPNPKGEQSGKSLANPFQLMKPHATLAVPKLKKMIRQMAWSTWGEWLVGVGDTGLLCLWQVGRSD